MKASQKTRLQALLSVAHHDYEKGLNLYALRKISNSATGKDLVQDTFTKAWGYLVKGGEITAMRSFLYHILNNLIIDEYRKHKATSLDALLEKGFEPIIAGQKLGDILDNQLIFLKIRRLPKTYRKIMRLRYVKGHSITEIALLTDQSRNNISVKIHRGLRRLKSLA